jgi:hypothetical protein
MAGPAGGSGTEAGGTGGGRSLKNCAETGADEPRTIRNPSKGQARRRVPRHNPLVGDLPPFMMMLFTENAANSSLHRLSEADGTRVYPQGYF